MTTLIDEINVEENEHEISHENDELEINDRKELNAEYFLYENKRKQHRDKEQKIQYGAMKLWPLPKTMRNVTSVVLLENPTDLLGTKCALLESCTRLFRNLIKISVPVDIYNSILQFEI